MSDQKRDIWGNNGGDLSDAIMSELGLDSGQPDFTQARKHFAKAAKEGNAWAQVNTLDTWRKDLEAQRIQVKLKLGKKRQKWPVSSLQGTLSKV